MDNSYYNPRPIDEEMTVRQIRKERPGIEDTICFYISKKVPIREIAIDLRLTEKVCKSLVRLCKKNGALERYYKNEWGGIENIIKAHKEFEFKEDKLNLTDKNYEDLLNDFIGEVKTV